MDRTHCVPTLTQAEMRERVEEIAIEAYVDARDHTEPLELLIGRVRAGLHYELEQLAELSFLAPRKSSILRVLGCMLRLD